MKAVFFDIDGTLLDHTDGKSVMPQSTIDSLAAMRKKGIKLFVATGRDPIKVDDADNYFPFDGFVTLNGQIVKTREGVPIRMAPHDPENIRKLIPLVHKADFPCVIIEEDRSFPANDNEFNRQHFQWAGVPFPPFYDPARLDEHPVYQFLAYMPLEESHILTDVLDVEPTSSGGCLLDVIPRGGGKEVGIAAVADYYGFAQKEIMVFGDGINDVRMLRWAGIGVAMGNGSDTVKAAADYVTTPVSDNGIKNALLHFGVLTEEDFR